MLLVKKRGRETDWKCSYCGKFVPYDMRVTHTETNMRWDYHREDAVEDFEAYHKTCKDKADKKQRELNASN